MSETDTIIDDVEAPSHREIVRGIGLQAAAVAKVRALEAEKILKGFYCDFVFGRLNLMKHR